MPGGRPDPDVLPMGEACVGCGCRMDSCGLHDKYGKAAQGSAKSNALANVAIAAVVTITAGVHLEAGAVVGAVVGTAVDAAFDTSPGHIRWVCVEP